MLNQIRRFFTWSILVYSNSDGDEMWGFILNAIYVKGPSESGVRDDDEWVFNKVFLWP